MKKNYRAIITGAAGFTGSALVNELLSEGIEIFAIVRPNSTHNYRLPSDNPLLHIIELEPVNYINIPDYICSPCNIFFHLMWTNGITLDEQRRNVTYTLDAIKASKICGCNRFISTGSQAEYGIIPINTIISEELYPNPVTPYGIAKVEACNISKEYASENKIEWIWCRIFSLIGKNEPKSRMLPKLFLNLCSDATTYLSSCRQNWDYLDVRDAAKALKAIGEKGHAGEIYNIANGNYRPLKDYTELLKSYVSPNTKIIYGEDPNPFVSLQPSISKISMDTGWTPKYSFLESIEEYYIDLLNDNI